MITALGAFPVDRKGSDIGAIKKSFRVLKQGQVLGIFPEGTRVQEMDLDNTKPGIALISIKSKSPVIPVFIDSEYKLFSKIVINIGEPIYFDEYYDQQLEAEDYLEISKDIMKTIYSLKKIVGGKDVKLYIAEHAGFCFGVKRAVDIATDIVNNRGDTNVYSLGPLVHNPQVVENFSSKGLKVIDNTDNLKEGKVIIRSHGVSYMVEKKIEESKLKLIDCTCPYVKAIHKRVKKVL